MLKKEGVKQFTLHPLSPTVLVGKSHKWRKNTRFTPCGVWYSLNPNGNPTQTGLLVPLHSPRVSSKWKHLLPPQSKHLNHSSNNRTPQGAFHVGAAEKELPQVGATGVLLAAGNTNKGLFEEKLPRVEECVHSEHQKVLQLKLSYSAVKSYLSGRQLLLFDRNRISSRI